jgi:hypothetical protein
VRRVVRDVLAVELDRAAAGMIETVDRAQRRRLPRAVRTDERTISPSRTSIETPFSAWIEP